MARPGKSVREKPSKGIMDVTYFGHRYSYDWETDPVLFKKLDKEFHFTLDCCATKENAKCKKFFSLEDDALSQIWGGRVFMNPPYGREIGVWIEKAFNSVMDGNCELVVCLIPSRTDTKWFHKYAFKGEIRFLFGRPKHGINGKFHTGPFASCVVVFKRGAKDCKCWGWRWKKNEQDKLERA